MSRLSRVVGKFVGLEAVGSPAGLLRRYPRRPPISRHAVRTPVARTRLLLGCVCSPVAIRSREGACGARPQVGQGRRQGQEFPE